MEKQNTQEKQEKHFLFRVYVGTYGKYNAGNLSGGWIEINGMSWEQFQTKSRELHTDEADPEFMIQDSELPDGFSNKEWYTSQEWEELQEAIKEANKPQVEIIAYSDKAIAVIGDTTPIKDQLKKLGGKFNPRLSCGAGWIFSNKCIDKVNALIGGSASVTTSTSSTTSSIEEYIDHIKKIYPTDKTLLDYFRNKTSAVVKLSNGMYLPFEKPKIETDFWFAESSIGTAPTMNEALRSCAVMKSSQQAFIDANTRKMRDNINELEGEGWFCLKRKYHSENGVELPIANYHSLRVARYYSGDEIPLTKEDRQLIIEAEKRELEKFTKRLNTYLKRYGLSKVSARTYWADR